ncbi:MAG: hypothetical protein IJ743_00540 [Bacilli bacterium]|nr:hypothetical protein [Methanobrevibacter sp.]MBR1748263.1 hypothetical protein [Bacilli bacterium]
MNILNGLDAVRQIMHECIISENTNDGVLSDVESIITVANNEEGVDEPCVWINQHPTIVAPGSKTSLSNIVTLQTTFEFVCIEYDPDPEIAERKGQNLASRCVLAVMRNYQRLQAEYNKRVIHNIEFNMFYPVGEVTIQGKRDKVPATSVSLNIKHQINWLNCCKTKKK